MLALYFQKPKERCNIIFPNIDTFPRLFCFIRLLLLAAFILVTTACSNRANIEISFNNEELVAKYSFDAPIEKVDFLTSDNVSRANFDVASTANVKVTNQSIEFDNSIENFEIVVAADTAPKDRIYPNFVKIDRSVAVVNLDGLLIRAPNKAFKVAIHNAIDPRSKRCTQKLVIDPFADYPEKYAIGRYVIISDSHDQCIRVSGELLDNHTSTQFYFNSNASQLGDQVGDNWALLSSQYPEIGKISQPMILLAKLNNPTNDTWQGDAGWYSTIFLREYGPSKSENRFAQGEQSKFIAHELVHLWIGKHFPVRISRTNKKSAEWLSEGAAEYTALLNSNRLGRLSSIDLKTKLENAINGCMNKVEGRFFENSSIIMHGSLPYDCGVLFVYLFDLSERHSSSQEKTVFDFWNAFLRQLDQEDDNTIYVEDMLSAMKDDNGEISKLVFGPQFDYSNLVQMLNKFDIETSISRRSNNRLARSALVFYILENTCPGNGFGFHGLDNHIELDIGKCDLLTNNFPVENINGFNVNKEAATALKSLESTCNNNHDGMIRLNEGSNRFEAIHIPCPKAAVPSLKELSIVSAPYSSNSK